jgi:ElaB/YqjD/DUF883 family membrane-anchored ribosome-binding protein
MSDHEIPESQSAPSSAGEGRADEIADEFRQLGKNLISMLQSTWESEERKKLQQEIESGLRELGDTLNQAATDFRQSPAGQKLKADVEDFHTRVRSGEVESKIRTELVSILRQINSELTKVTAPGATSATPMEAEKPTGEG